jgi:type II secretory pathway component GspD/PulD (secretin)
MATLLCLAVLFGIAATQYARAQENRIIVCLLPLEHADAEQLVSVLSPLLSPQGIISAYPHANTIIIKDRESVVKMLVKAVKGRPDLAECDNWHPEAENRKQSIIQ